MYKLLSSAQPPYLLLSLLLILSTLLHPTAPTPLHPPSLPPPTLSPRTPTALLPNTGLHLSHSRTLQAFPPSLPCSAALALFYTRVLELVVREWLPRHSPVDNLMIHMGPLQWTFVADTLGKEIPWNVIGELAYEMIRWSERGYAATWDRGYWNRAGTLGVYVMLRVAPDWWEVPLEGNVVDIGVGG